MPLKRLKDVRGEIMFKQGREPKAKAVPSAFCREEAFLGSLLKCGILVQ